VKTFSNATGMPTHYFTREFLLEYVYFLYSINNTFVCHDIQLYKPLQAALCFTQRIFSLNCKAATKQLSDLFVFREADLVTK